MGSGTGRRWALAIGAALWLAAAGSGQAQRLHAVVIGDISPAAGWGKFTANVAMDVTTFGAALRDQVPEDRLDLTTLELDQDETSDPALVLGVIRDWEVAPRDTVLCYFSGHGVSDDQGHRLVFAQGGLARRDLLAALREKGARLTVLLSDCCNLRSDGYTYLAPFIQSRELREPTPLFDALFFRPEGVVDINSSSPGESAFFAPYDEDMKEMPGSIFTREFCDWVEANRDTQRTWDELVRAVSLRVHTAFREHYPKGIASSGGGALQTRQTVYPVQYPGMPDREGPRTGLLVRDFPGPGAMITRVEPGSPAAEVFLIGQETFRSLEPGQVIVSVDGQAVANAAQMAGAIAAARQIARLGIREAGRGDFDVLIRMRY